MTTTPRRPATRPERFRDELIRPFLTLAMVGGTAVQWPLGYVLFPPVALPLFVLTSIASVVALLPWTRLTARQQVAVATAAMVLGAVLLPFAHRTTTAALFPYVAAAVA